MGRAYYEQAAYAEAEKYYKRLRQLAPTRFEDMEIFSTILWHLKRETDLAFLAHELIEASWRSPQAWCALGNSWSLARDHEQALRSFKRATQLDPKFAYAFTLQGHEHVANEEYEKAQICYRAGMSADKRHYNAWYGVGRVYDKLGNYDKAFAHFTAASQINPTNAVLICCIGTVLEKQKQPKEALIYYSRATELAPQSTLTRYKLARTLMALGDLKQALAQLEVLKSLAPDEAMVHFLLGRLYKSLREKGLAVRHFTVALNLDPKVISPSSFHLEYELTSIFRQVDRSKKQLKVWKMIRTTKMKRA
jgi:anaphase-promoting complex subunit 3